MFDYEAWMAEDIEDRSGVVCANCGDTWGAHNDDRCPLDSDPDEREWGPVGGFVPEGFMDARLKVSEGLQEQMRIR